MSEPHLVVIRPAPDLPDGFLPDHLNGLWVDLNQFPPPPDDDGAHLTQHPTAVFAPTGRFETRESDGAVAEVYEARP